MNEGVFFVRVILAALSQLLARKQFVQVVKLGFPAGPVVGANKTTVTAAADNWKKESRAKFVKIELCMLHGE